MKRLTVTQRKIHSALVVGGLLAGVLPKVIDLNIALDELHIICTCPDYRTNLIGTCKHVEGVLVYLREACGQQHNQRDNGNDETKFPRGCWPPRL
jgi:uncharacterized Zn finger protein